MATLTDQEIGAFQVLKRIQLRAAELEKEDKQFAAQLKTLIGKRITTSRGLYEITHISSYLGKVRARGRKVVKNGQLGRNTWDLHRVDEHSFPE